MGTSLVRWPFPFWVLPILSGLSSLNETVEVPRPPDFVVTMISPLSSLAGPTRHTILLADIHSAVSMQLWPQMDRPEMELERKRWNGWKIQTHTHTRGTNKHLQCKHTRTGIQIWSRVEELAQTALSSISKFSQTVTRGQSSSRGHSWRGWPWSSSNSLNCLNLMWVTPQC